LEVEERKLFQVLTVHICELLTKRAKTRHFISGGELLPRRARFRAEVLK
jgi:hypothetical protein